jgi:TatD DNase family protein
MFIDSHAHVNFNAFKPDADEVLKNSLKENTWVVNIGSELDTSRRAVEMADKYEQGVYAVVGLHPIHLYETRVDEDEVSFNSRVEKFDALAYRELCKNPKVVGIGECGLEYYHLPAEGEDKIKQAQKEIFLQQIDLAVDLGKTLVVHSRDAYEPIYDILKEQRSQLKQVIIHSFIGNWAQAEKFLDLDCYISFNGIITYKPRKEKQPGQSEPGLQEAVVKTPLNRILLETDCPYLSPEPLRGERNVPENVKYVALKIAALKDMEPEEVEAQTTENAKAVYGL